MNPPKGTTLYYFKRIPRDPWTKEPYLSNVTADGRLVTSLGAAMTAAQHRPQPNHRRPNPTG